MKSDLFYCSMLLTLYSIANLLFLASNDDDFYDLLRGDEKHCLSKHGENEGPL